MKNLKVTILILGWMIVLSTASSFVFAGPLTENEALIIKAVAPIYPPIAIHAGAKGKIEVDVKINAIGEVTSAKAKEGYPLLRIASERAAQRWRFAPDVQGQKERTVNLLFIFNMVSEAESHQAGTIFSQPYQIEITIVLFKPFGIKNNEPKLKESYARPRN
jgi:TonB family protein